MEEATLNNIVSYVETGKLEAKLFTLLPPE